MASCRSQIIGRVNEYYKDIILNSFKIKNGEFQIHFLVSMEPDEIA